MGIVKIKKDNVVYVLCPAYIKTGGPELLHQLVYKMNSNGIKAFITYYGIDETNQKKECTHDDFKKYIKSYKKINEIPDNENSIIISPESVTALKILFKFSKVKKIIWWLSVDNFTKNYGLIMPIKKYGLINTIKKLLRNKLLLSFNKIKEVDYHLCQSNYAIDFLQKKSINKNQIYYLSDYISKEYLEISEDQWPKKEDNVLYNPKKGFEFTQKVINKANDLNFIPIQNLTTNQVKELLLKSKIYIDFGNHPGKDRFPREAAVCGCCVITGKRGSAKYYKDVPISDEYKFEDEYENIDSIINKIRLCIDDYNNEIKNFKDYRDFIKSEELLFEKDVLRIFLDKE